MSQPLPAPTPEVLQAFADAWNRHDVDALMSFMTEDCVFEASGGAEMCGTRCVGREAVRAGYAEVWSTFPDAHWGNARHFVLGDRGVSEWTFTGTRTDGGRVEVNGCDLFTFRDGKIAVKNSFRKNRPPLRPTMPISTESVVDFLHEFESLAQREDFSLIRDSIDENAYFRFNDGDFVGRAAIQSAFEKTWQGDPTVKRARFYLTDVKVLTVDDKTATATYTYNWEGSQGDRTFAVTGRGTRVLTRQESTWRIVHEHLSRFPNPLK